jgi:hypothetical protein
MLPWILLSMGLALSVMIAACVLAMMRAERRTRRSLYASLGFGEDLISVLMTRRGPVSMQLALVRQASISGRIRLDELRRPERSRRRRSFRFKKAQDDGPTGLGRPALAPVRRRPPPGRDHV